MCLERISLRQTATKDILCYKLVREDLSSPCYNFKYQVGQIFHTNLDLRFKREEVHEGFHTFANLDEAIEALKINWNDKSSNGYIIYNYASIILECVIPKNAQYYSGKCLTGVFHGNLNAYASDSLKVNKIINLESEL